MKIDIFLFKIIFMTLQKYWFEDDPDDNHLILQYDNDQHYRVLLDQHSGKIVGCKKLVGVYSITHTGICLGRLFGTQDYLFIHSHHHNGGAVVSNQVNFCGKSPIQLEEVACTNPRNKVLSIGLDHVRKGTHYNVLYANCQHLTSQACNNKPISKDLERFKQGVAYASMGALAIGCFSLFFRRT